MSWKNLKQQSFAEALLVEHKSLTELDEVHNLIDWSKIEVMLSGIHNKSRGEQAWPPVLMFKAMLLQAWYKLSDPQLEKQVARDLLFRRFLGLSLSESVPDHSSYWRFRNHPDVVALQAELLAEINRQLSTHGAYIQTGGISIIDASVVKAHQNRPGKGKSGGNTQDAEADYSVKYASDGQRKTTYGYKAHCNVDEDGLIQATEFTAGNVHDSRCFAELLIGQEERVYADSAYASEGTEALLNKLGIENAVLERAYRNKPLTAEQKRNNRVKSRIRSTVERTFGVLKQHYGLGRARYLGLLRNKMRFNLMCMAHNIKRGLNILREAQTWQGRCA